MARAAAASASDFRQVLPEAYAVNDRMNQLVLEHLDPQAWRAKLPGGRVRTIAAIFAGEYSDAADKGGFAPPPECLFMDGQELFLFTLKRIPPLVEATAKLNGCLPQDVDWFIFHQANAFMNEHIRTKLRIPKEKAPIVLEDVGNTVSNTIPLTMHRTGGQFKDGQRLMLVGFGVGYSWGACMLEWDSVQRI